MAKYLYKNKLFSETDSGNIYSINSTTYLFNVNMFLLLTLNKNLFNAKLYQCIACFFHNFPHPAWIPLQFHCTKKWSFVLRISSVNVTKIHSFLRIWLHLLKKSLVENIFLCSIWTMKNIEHGNLLQANAPFCSMSSFFLYFVQLPEIFQSLA